MSAALVDVIQGSPEWLTMRAGMCTGSRVADAIGKMKRQPKEGPVAYYAAREAYMWEVVVSRITGRIPDKFVTAEMQWGIENEPLAIAAYEERMDCMTEPCGFAYHPRIKWFGSSPDFLVGDDGGGEVKCPTSAKHLQYLIDGVVPDEHIAQLKANMACTGRKWWDFISFDPRMPKDLRLFVRRLERDEPMIVEMETEVQKFLADVDVLMQTIEKRKAALVLTSFQVPEER